MSESADSQKRLQRLPQYYRILKNFVQNGIFRCNSAQIAAHTAYSAVAVRRDLQPFAGCAKQGYGYHVKQLYTALGTYLGVRDQFRAVLVGHTAPLALLADHPLFSVHGIRLCGVCTTDDTTLPLPKTSADDLAQSIVRWDASLLILLSPLEKEQLKSAIDAGIVGVYSLCEEEEAVLDVCRAAAIPYRILHPMDALMALCCECKQAQVEQ